MVDINLNASNAVLSDSYENNESSLWSENLRKLLTFRHSFIDDHLVEKSATVPDNRPTLAHRHKRMGYQLFKESYVKNIHVFENVSIPSSAFCLLCDIQ